MIAISRFISKNLYTKIYSKNILKKKPQNIKNIPKYDSKHTLNYKFEYISKIKYLFSNHIQKLYIFFFQHPSQTISITVLLTICLFLPQIWLAGNAYHNFNTILANELRLQMLSDRITYFDEVLTMSARMNAVTGNRAWERRYKQFEPLLDAVIKESINLAPEAYESKDAIKTDKANQRLVAMELESFDLVGDGKLKAAQTLLSNSEYETEKINYAVGVARINKAIQNQIATKVKGYRFDLLISASVSVASLIMLIPSWLLVLHLLKKYLQEKFIAQTALEETNKKLENRVELRTQELTQKNYQLKIILDKLKSTQIQLIHTEKMSSLGQMIAGIAHEINNPVSFIYGNITYIREYVNNILELVNIYQEHYPQRPPEIEEFAEAIELDFVKEDLSKIVESMYVGTERIKKIVLSLRNFSRLDESDFKKVDIHQGMDSTLMILQNRLKSQVENLEISLIKEYGNIPLIECYPSQLNQAFMNIISNAIDILEEKVINSRENESKFQQNQPFRPTITICTQVKDEEKVQIIISDNGQGINEKVKQKLFDPFFTTKVVGKGTGLGLSISYQIIVSKHKGRLFCNSILGEGTDFIIEIPISQS
ncbi:MAG: ATP-binding protein [Cyanobacteria bacterium P01_A01_bin.45]